MQQNIRLLILSGLFATLTAVGAFVKIPFYPVPFTLQNLFTALAALALPARWAVLSQVTYLMIGFMGLPVFANGGGLGYVLQPTFGYLLFLPISAYVIAKGVELLSEITLGRMVVVVFLGMILLLTGGAIWLYFHFIYILDKEVSLVGVLYSGMILFLPSALIKTVVVCLLGRALSERHLILIK
jgi:biotin transport system substrate-specific component